MHHFPKQLLYLYVYRCPESGSHCDYALDSEDPLPLEVIAVHPGPVDNENPLQSDRSCRAFHEEELPFWVQKR